jgi:UDP-N-acetylglucosamine 2-epimerase (non-hydrolysing)
VSILCIVGTRPEAIKLAPVIRALREGSNAAGVRVCLTAQHRDLVDEVLRFFEIDADLDLDVMRPDQSLPALTSALFRSLEHAIARERPGWIVVQGDTTSAMAAAIVGHEHGVKVVHVEAGLRTFDTADPFPEEINRTLIARAATLHCAPTDTSRANLLAEGVDPASIHVTGNTGIDALQWRLKDRSRESIASDSVRTVLVTLHRRESFGAPLEGMCSAIADIARRAAGRARIVWPVHPNPNVSTTVRARLSGVPNVQLIDPLPYCGAVDLLASCHFVITDSGGLQEEGPWLGKPVLVLRERTERPEGVAAGVAALVGRDPARITAAAMRLLDDDTAYARMATRANLYGDGRAAERIAALMVTT